MIHPKPRAGTPAGTPEPVRKTAPATPLRELVSVHPGGSQMRFWPAGTVVTALRGGVWFSPSPHWLGEQLVRPRCRIEAHASHVMAEAGWVVLWAEQASVLQVLPGVAGPTGFEAVVQPGWRALRAAWRRARQRFGRGPRLFITR